MLPTEVRAVPGEAHPAYSEESVRMIRYIGRTRNNGHGPPTIEIPFQQEITAYEGTVGPGSVQELSPPVHTLTRTRAVQSLYPEYGWYEWYVWTDELGRSVAEEHARWIKSSTAFLEPTWNPVKS